MPTYCFQEDWKSNPTTGQIEMPLIYGEDGTHSTSSTERGMLAKGPLSGIVPGGGETTSSPATNTPAAGWGGSSLPFSGLPTGIPGVGTSQADGGGQSSMLVLGGFSFVVMPMRGMNMANMASMLSTGQQLGQMLPKPAGV